MSMNLVIGYSDDGELAEMPASAPRDYHNFDYGSSIAAFMDRLGELTDKLGLRNLLDFVCEEAAYDEVLAFQEALADAEGDENDEEAERLKDEIASSLPAYSPEELLETVRGLVDYLVEHPVVFDNEGERPGDEPILRPDGTVQEGPDGMTSTQTVMAELKAFELILEDALDEGRMVFLCDS